jgi:DNA mismatch endonuclease, patch repair protein
MDTVSREKRSWIMARVPQRSTNPEIQVRALLRILGFRYWLNVRTLPGSPDIVVPASRVAIFVHGCFWHRHSGCKFASTPKTRTDYWDAKFKRNVERDQRVSLALRKQGWKTLVIWGCQLRREKVVLRRLDRFLSTSQVKIILRSGQGKLRGKRAST